MGDSSSTHCPLPFIPRSLRECTGCIWTRLQDFARSPDGAELKYGDWSSADSTLSFNLWWPNQDSTDPTIENVRKEISGKSVYGYGGIDISCPHWHKMYAATVPIAVHDVVRERGKVELWTGSTVHWGNDSALHFFAIDPLRMVVDIPSTKPIALGGSNQPTSDESPCPALVLADFQIDVILSTQPPSREATILLQRSYALSVGMTRAAVAWQRGYPNEFGDREQLDRENVWQYFDGPLDGYSITFADDRVVSFTKPQGMP